MAKSIRYEVLAAIVSLLACLPFSASSQTGKRMLVFSKTSKQNDLISPQTPRAIYFGDEAYLGYSLGGSIEIAVVDPDLGPVFYLLEPDPRRTRPLRFHRDASCLSCHGGPFTPGVPGVLVRSVFPAATGHPILSQGSTVVDTTTPFDQRWGGWYVTGDPDVSPADASKRRRQHGGYGRRTRSVRGKRLLL